MDWALLMFFSPARQSKNGVIALTNILLFFEVWLALIFK